MATYKTNSVYALTPMDAGKLGIWKVPEVEITGNEVTIITVSYTHLTLPRKA